MTTATAPVTTETGSAVGRVIALARLELTMLIRNKTALFNALALGPLMVLFISSITLSTATDRSATVAALVGSLVVFALVFAAYYNLCTTAVARREELMLKRLTTGELSRAEVLIAMAVPAFAVILAQVVLGGVAIVVLVGAPAMVNPVLPVIGLLLGFVALAVLGYATATITRTVEAAQITTLLPLSVLILLSGSTFPFAMMPEPMRVVAELTPLGAAFELMTLGLSGTAADGSVHDLAGSFGAALMPTAVLAVWVVAGAYLVQRVMPWEPRR